MKQTDDAQDGLPPGSTSPGDGRARRLRILTWHVHGNYLYALTQVPHDFVVPVLPGDPPGYGRPGPRIPWGGNLAALPAEDVREQDFDCIVYQSPVNLEDARTLLTDRQRALPSIFLEHNPPDGHATNTVHPFRHDRGMVVHVTHYNALMWDCGDMPVRVVEHGVPVPAGVRYTGELARGIVVINNLDRRGRRMGPDLYDAMRRQVPLDLIGMGNESLDGLGEVPNMEVAAFMARYRFFFSPIRYTSLGLSLVEAMLTGTPVVGVAATELPAVIRNGENGYVDTRPERLVDVMRELLADPELARRWGEQGRRDALARFSMERFVNDWSSLLSALTEASWTP